MFEDGAVGRIDRVLILVAAAAEFHLVNRPAVVPVQFRSGAGPSPACFKAAARAASSPITLPVLPEDEPDDAGAPWVSAS